MTESIEEVAARLDAVRSGKEYKFLCPCHDDHNPSAYLRMAKNGRIYADCYVCNDWEKVTKAVGLWHEPGLNGSGAAHLNNNGNGNSGHDAKASTPKQRKDDGKAHIREENIAFTYDYRDEAGEFLFQKVRYEEEGRPKNFRQRTLDADKKWTWSLDGVRIVPYRLPELLATPADEWVYIAEGEKAVGALVDLGLMATCNFDGASENAKKGKWRDEYDAHFAGRKVAILPDNDEPGAVHALDVARHLKPVAASVRMVTLPDLPPKGDAWDWRAAGGTADALLALVEATEDWQPPKLEPVDAMLEGSAFSLIKGYADQLGVFSLSELDDQLYLNGHPVNDVELAPLEVAIHNYNADKEKAEPHVAVGAIRPTILSLAQRKRFHPIRDWLDSLQWDGKNHFLALAQHFKDGHPPITDGKGGVMPYFNCLFGHWLAGSVQRAYEGTQNPMLVLAGPQGIGKSFLPMWLAQPLGAHHGYRRADANPYFCEGPINPDSIDDQRRLTNKFIWEVGEVGGTMRKADLDALKLFLAKSASTFRVPYFKYDTTKPALCSWIATVNPSIGFLNDLTGNRRYRTVELTSIDWSYSKNIDAEQLWAQAVHWYRQGVTATLLPEEEVAIAKVTQRHLVTDDETESILLFYEFAGDDVPEAERNSFAWSVYTAEVTEHLAKNVLTLRNTNTNRVGRALAKLVGTPSIVFDDRRRGFYGVRLKPEIARKQESEAAAQWMWGR